MHPVAKRCLTWAIVLAVVGVIAYAYGLDISYWWQERVGAGAEPALWGFGVVMNFIRNFALPLAAGLVTATIIIQTLAPQVRTDDEDGTNDEDAVAQDD